MNIYIRGYYSTVNILLYCEMDNIAYKYYLSSKHFKLLLNMYISLDKLLE